MEKFAVGKIVTGCVTGVENYGIFVSLDDYYSGLVHISEISQKFVRDVHDFADVGETIRVKIIERDDKHLKLSIKDIDYRINRKRHSHIEETEKGFETLSKRLDKWIDDKYEELNLDEDNQDDEKK